MIRVNRRAAPNQLAREEASRLPVIEGIINGGNAPSSDDFEGYKCAAEPLFQLQYSKCVYCEKKIESTYQDVEHFRPKTLANREPGSIITSGYWWLAWCWENLFFSCPNCNRPKGIQFPLATNSVVLKAKDPPPGAEDALLIDPSREDPLDHIWFRPCGPGDGWRPVAKTERGVHTIRVCRLDRPDLLDQYAQHVQHSVWPRVERLRGLSKQNSQQDLTKALKEVSKTLLSARSPFAGLSYDALCYLLQTTPNITIHKPPL
jgi:uncharacterized protein (TIGR02646 family)